MSFVHIHNHTEYSLLDGANRIPQMVSRAGELGMDALAITDHGVMFGVMEFYFECKKQGIKPLIGMEAYVAPEGRQVKAGREENQNRHLVLLARNIEGYRNLCKLHTVAALEGFYYKPRIDRDLLREHARGLIGTSACLGSEICQELLKGTYDRAQWLAGEYKEIFDEGCFFIELQDHRLPEQAQIKDALLRIARELKLPLVATNDAHYLCKGDHEAHDVLLCVGTGRLKGDPDRLRFDTEEFYLKTPAEMAELFADNPEALENTARIAEMCELELGQQRALMPTPEMPEGETPRTFLRKLAEQGLRERLPNADDEAHRRLEYELGVIEKTGFEDYFLLVREFADFTRSQGIYYGVRGSAAGSLVSYTLGITDVDPLQYDLTFERFLNPERISMPDIDMDFEDARRDEVIRWVTERYGADRVAQIVTFGTLGAKAAIKDAGRVMAYTPQETDRICKTIANVPGMTLAKALEEGNEFRQMVDTEERVASLVEVAKSIEGLSRHCGVHAAGIVISRDPLQEHIPLYRGNDGQAITAFEMGILEKIGLLKMDFLGLSNLTVLAKTVENVNHYRGEEAQPLRTADIPFDDEATFEMLGRGDTIGVFQLESAGMRRAIVELKPRSVKELAALVALYRPGPMDHIPTYIGNKHGRSQPEYADERMRPILEETYGVIVYQDQVLKLVQALAGFSLGKADILRRAMGKKDKAAMDSMKVEFMSGCRERGVSDEAAERIWELLLPFAGYAFNKAHAVCYAILAYQTAYLKANYPVEYMAALLAVYRSKEDRVTAFIEECRRKGIAVLPPDVGLSGADFTIETTAAAGTNGKKGKKTTQTRSIRFGLAAIKGVGDGIVASLLQERAKAPFTHLYEFCERMKPHGMNRAALDAMIKAGALDCIDKNRARLLEFSEAGMAFADTALRNREAGQESLFGGGEQTSIAHYPQLPDREPPSRSEALGMEKEVLGIFVSDHPLRGYEHTIRSLATHRCGQITELEEGTAVKLAGLIANLRAITTKRGDRMASLVLEDLSGQAACTVFAATYAKLKDLLEKDKVVCVSGIVTHRERTINGGERQVEVRVEDLAPVEAGESATFDDDESTEGTVVIRVGRATRDQLLALRRLIEDTPGDYGVVVQLGAGAEAPPLRLLRHVGADEAFFDKARRTVAQCEIEVIRRASLVSNGFEAEEMLA
jgi:DNA polymerase-3 subunit alpha